LFDESDKINNFPIYFFSPTINLSHLHHYHNYDFFSLSQLFLALSRGVKSALSYLFPFSLCVIFYLLSINYFLWARERRENLYFLLSLSISLILTKHEKKKVTHIYASFVNHKKAAKKFKKIKNKYCKLKRKNRNHFVADAQTSSTFVPSFYHPSVRSSATSLEDDVILSLLGLPSDLHKSSSGMKL
jgi:hypothetical protein